MPIAKNLADLLQQAEKLTADIDTGEEVPRVHRNLQQLAETGQRLLDRTAHVPDDSMDVKAYVSLSKHVTAEHTRSRLCAQISRMFELGVRVHLFLGLNLIFPRAHDFHDLLGGPSITGIFET